MPTTADRWGPLAKATESQPLAPCADMTLQNGRHDRAKRAVRQCKTGRMAGPNRLDGGAALPV